MKLRAVFLAMVLGFVTWTANATTFDLATLNDYVTGSGRQAVNHGYFTGLNGTGTEIFNGTSITQQNPWTQSLGNPDQASINFQAPGMGNNGGKIYMTAGAQFPIPTGESLGQNQSGFSGDYNLGNFPLYFTFSLPNYVSCGFNCSQIVAVPVTVNSLYVTGGETITITGYSDLGHTAIDTLTLTAPGNGLSVDQIVLDWTGIEEISMTGANYYVNDIEVNDPLSAVPEPSSLSLLGTGLAVAGLLKRRLGQRVVSIASYNEH